MMKGLWLGLIVFRLLWAVLPQSGYIHPDEFFQTVEVMAGEAFNISIERTWEFNASFPLRSVAIPQLIFSPVFKILAFLDETTGFILSAYHIIASYRFIMAVLSISIDINILKVCRILRLPCKIAGLLVACSYVTLTFLTHSFSNSFETLMLSTLIVLIVQCKDSEHNRKNEIVVKSQTNEISSDKEDKSDEMCDLDSSFNNLHEMAFVLRKRNVAGTDTDTSCSTEHVISKTDDGQDATFSDKHVNQNMDRNSSLNKTFAGLYSHVVLIAVTLVVGTFNRPTFVLFSFLPCLWWLHGFYREIFTLFKRAFVFLFAAMTTAFVLISIDTIYYNNISIMSVFQKDTWLTIFRQSVVTPVNFIQYNSVVTNLASHGHHPFYVHFTVNMPMLYGPYLFCLAKSFTNKFLMPLIRSSKVLKNSNHALGQYAHIDSALFLSFTFFPVLCLSVFPHQEARFLIPLLPLVVLSVVSTCGKLSKLFWIMFVAFNLILSIVFGVLHQGGVIPCLLHLQKLHHSGIHGNKTMHVIFSHTYMPPKHLLMSQPSHLKLDDMRGHDLNLVYKKLVDIKSTFVQHSVADYDNNHNIYLALPGPLVSDLKTLSGSDISYGDEFNFFPHLSFEDPPAFHTVDSLTSLYNLMSLVLVEVS